MLACLLTTHECRIDQQDTNHISYATTKKPSERNIQNFPTLSHALDILVSKNPPSREKTAMISEKEQELAELARNQTLATLSKLELPELSIIASFLLYLRNQREPEEQLKTVLRQPVDSEHLQLLKSTTTDFPPY